MLRVARIDLPSRIELRLKKAAAFVDSVMDFARDDLVGFRRPLAAAFALTAPIVFPVMFYFGGWQALALVAAGNFAVTGFGLYLIGRGEWPALVEEFETRSLAKSKAAADLRCGYGEACFINLTRAPAYFEHEEGVLVFADAGEFRTLFFSIERGDRDPRWALYRSGDLDRRVWRWLRLPVSREIADFSAEGTKLPNPNAVVRIGSIDAWEAINVALGEPADGAVIHRPLDELIHAVELLS